MRIAIFEHVPEGGAKRVAYEQAAYLSGQGHQILYLTGEAESVFDVERVVDRLQRFRLTEPQVHGWRRLRREWWLVRELPKIYKLMHREIDSFAADVVLVHPSQITQAPGLLKTLLRPSLYYMQEPWRIGSEKEFYNLSHVPALKRWYASLRRRYIARVDRENTLAADQLMTNSQFSQKEIERYYGRKAEVNWPGVDTEFFSPVDFDFSKRSQVLFVGSKTDLDGYPLVEAVEKRFDDWPVKVVDFSSGYGLSEVELRRAYREAVVTLCLARREPFGMVPLESMACGTPVIAVDEGGYQETVVDGETGWLVERSVDALLVALTRLSQKPQLWQQLSRGGRKRVEETFSWQRHGAKLEERLKELGGAS